MTQTYDSSMIIFIYLSSYESLTIIFYRSQFIHLWNIDSQHLIRIIQLPSKIKEVKSVAFVNDALSVDSPQVSSSL